MLIRLLVYISCKGEMRVVVSKQMAGESAFTEAAIF